MPDRYELRHQDYRLNVGTVLAGQTVRSATLQLDNDAAFILRGRAIHIRPIPDATGVLANDPATYYDRYTGPDGDYYSQDVTQFALENRNLGKFGQFLPVRVPVVYPPGGSIQADVTNTGLADMVGVEIYFRGSKIFAPGVLGCETYPPRLSPQPFDYVASPQVGFVGFNQGCSQLDVQESRFNLVQNIASDADFVCRKISIGSWAAASGLISNVPPSMYFQLYVQFMDWSGKPYSNLPVHADTCFGVNECDIPFWNIGLGEVNGSLLYSTFDNATLVDSSVGTNHPSLLLPEIYLPANRVMYFNLIREDSFLTPVPFAGPLQPVDIYIRFGGMKVFR